MILGSKAERIAACEREADIYVVNRENVVWLVDYYKSKWPSSMSCRVLSPARRSGLGP